MFGWLKTLFGKADKVMSTEIVNLAELAAAKRFGEHRIMQTDKDVFQVQICDREGDWRPVGWRVSRTYYEYEYRGDFYKKTREEAIAFGKAVEEKVRGDVLQEVLRLREHNNILYPTEYGVQPIHARVSDDGLLIQAVREINQKLRR
ncbi:hypothetical protein CcrJ4_gp437 [Caulobacter phage J4]|nr:hypothetical protein CcrJ4_gp437 [Caulobacter phage J4]